MLYTPKDRQPSNPAHMRFSAQTPERPSPDLPHNLDEYFISGTLQDMKTTIIETDRPWLTMQADPDVNAHIWSVRDEFYGQPELNFYNAALIIKIRRSLDLDINLKAFRHLWNAEGLTLLRNLNSRWIISALDTFVDHGEAHERANALVIVTFLNMLKLADTEYMLCGQPGYVESEIVKNNRHYPALWDGVRVFNLPDDDTLHNMIRRMRTTLAPTPFFRLVFELLLNKLMAENHTLLARMSQHRARPMW